MMHRLLMNDLRPFSMLQTSFLFLCRNTDEKKTKRNFTLGSSIYLHRLSVFHGKRRRYGLYKKRTITSGPHPHNQTTVK